MADVVEQGDGPEGPGRLPAWLPRLALGLAAVLAVAGLSRSGLLSADDPTPEPEPSSSETTAEPGEPAPRLVAREDDHLLLAAPGEPSPGARLPRDLPADAPLVPMRLRAGTTPLAAQGGGPLLAVAGGRLVRVDPGQPRWRPIGTADAVIAASFSPGRAVVQRGSDLAEVEIATGGVTEADPFPGFDADTWSARGVLAATGTGALVMTGPPTGGLSALALAWPTGVVRTGTRPQVQDLGMVGPLLAIADDWVITLGPGCPGAACRVQVVSVTRDQARTRDVAPPDGWTFIPGPAAGRTHEALVPVEHLTAGRPDGMQALARLVPGGDNALLVGRTSDVVLGAGLADGPGGSVYLLSASPGADGLQPRVWDPQQPAATRLLLPRSTFPENVRLACVCG